MPANPEASPPRQVSCPACGTPVDWLPENRYRPFCSARCKSIDFGAWAAEDYRIPQQESSADDAADQGAR